MSTNDVGNMGLGLAIHKLTEKGYRVSVPLTDTQSYDLVVDINDTLYKVMVRYTNQKATSGFYRVGLQTVWRSLAGALKVKAFDSSKIDFLFVGTPDAAYF